MVMRTPVYEWDKGVHLLGSELWFDAVRYDVLSFITSARLRDAWRHTRAICTDKTRALLRVSRPGFQALTVPYNRSFSLGPFLVTLMPAGVMPGSAQVRIESDYGVLLYANNLCLEPHPMAEAFQPARADVLVLKTAYGLQNFEFPRRNDAYKEIVSSATTALQNGMTPVFLTTPVGKAQEVIRALTSAGIKVEVHKSIAKYSRCYMEIGFNPGKTGTFRGSPGYEAVLIYPEVLRFSPSIKRLKHATLFWVSGLASSCEALERMRVSKGIALSSHLDFAGLMRFVEMVSPRMVYTVGKWAKDFACALRSKGVQAHALYEETQLSLF